jgi:hypothetical protein
VRQQAGICAICHEEFTDYNDIVPDHKNRKEWAERGGMTIRTIFKQPTGGATEKKDQPEWASDGRSAIHDQPTIKYPLCGPADVQAMCRSLKA